MDAYHVLMVHFPIALWMTATLAIFLRVFSDGPLARSVDHALVPLLSASLMFGIIAFSIGLMVWPWETISASALGRNHVLLASWTVAYWAVILFVRWRRGESVWQGTSRWVMAGLAFLGSALLGITGTLGGHLVGIYTEVSDLLRLLGWAGLGGIHHLLRAQHDLDRTGSDFAAAAAGHGVPEPQDGLSDAGVAQQPG